MKETNRNEDVMLIEAFRNGDAYAYNTLSDKYEALIASVIRGIKVKGYASNDRSVWDDLRSQANLAMLNAMNNYNTEDSKASFATYLTMCIRNELVRYANSYRLISIPEKKEAMVASYKKALDSVMTRNDGYAADEDVFAEVRDTMTYEQYQDAKEIAGMSFSSIDQKIGDDEDTTLGDMLTNDDLDACERMDIEEEMNERRSAMNYILGCLDEAERFIFTKHVDGDSFVDIAKAFGCTPANIRQKFIKIQGKVSELAGCHAA